MDEMMRRYWERAVDFHGHVCPGIAIGVRACQAACEALGCEFSQDEELVCITENDACGVDAVSALLGCTLGKGNLLYHGTGKMAFNFYDRKTQKSVRLYFKPLNMQGSREEKMNYILEADLDELFAFSKPTLPMPEPARHFTSVTCSKCGEAAPEHKIRLQDGKFMCLDCFQEYNRGL